MPGVGVKVVKFSLRKAAPEDLARLIYIDDQSSKLYETSGFNIALNSDHPFVLSESARWAHAIKKGYVYLAMETIGQPIGFVALGFVDGEPYLDQLSVLPDYMRCGVGTTLLERAIRWAGDSPIWLTTYSHIAWNRPYYEKNGFVQVFEKACGPELQEILREQRRALPEPKQRIAMVYRGI